MRFLAYLIMEGEQDLATELKRQLKCRKAGSANRLYLFRFAVPTKEKTVAETELTRNVFAVRELNHEEINDPFGHFGFVCHGL